MSKGKATSTNLRTCAITLIAAMAIFSILTLRKESLNCATNAGFTTQKQQQHKSSITDIFQFDSDLIPLNSSIDVNIGTNFSPFQEKEGRHRILVDPLFPVCESNAKLPGKVTAFCFAVSNYTGFSTFYEYNTGLDGQSSSLNQVTKGTSHEVFSSQAATSHRTVLVLEANILFSAIEQSGSNVYRLKLDMQGNDLTTLQNIVPLLKKENFITHIMAECFTPNKDGKQIYQADNSCKTMAELLEACGYQTKVNLVNKEWGDVNAYKKNVTTDFMPM